MSADPEPAPPGARGSPVGAALVAERMAALQQRCAAEGVPLTVQRRAVMEALAARADHPTVDQLHAGVCKGLPGVSKATVYRTLEALVRLGLAQRVAHVDSAVRFDPNTEPHHHFLCTRCGRLDDLSLEEVAGYEDLRVVLAEPEARTVEGVDVHVRGTCRACAGADR